MAKEYLSLSEVCKELQMSEAQVRALVTKGDLDTIDIGGETRFLRSEVAGFKQKAEGRETVVVGPGGRKPATPELEDEEDTDVSEGPSQKPGKLDLSEIEEEPGADESDQTSVLRSVTETGAPVAPPAEEPVFQFEEEDSTSFFPESEAKVAEETPPQVAAKPVEKAPAPPPKPKAAAEPAKPAAAAPKPAAAPAKPKEPEPELEEIELVEKEEPGDTEVVADILKEETGTGEDESLETVDLAELEGEGEGAETKAEEGTDITKEETVALEKGGEETAGAEGALLEVSDERIEEEEEEGAPAGAPLTGEAMAAAAAASEYVMVRPSILANILLAVSIAILILGGFLTICGAFGYYQNVVAKLFFDLLKGVV